VAHTQHEPALVSVFRLASLFFLAMFAESFIAPRTLASPPPGYYLVWGDEFDGTSLDPTKWWVWNQPDRSGYTVTDAVTVGGGYLTIHTYTTNGANYSAIISSDGRFRARYGYAEASVEFDGSPGMFSDFWLNSPNNGVIPGDSAACGGEIDVCEHRATDANDADDISGNVTIDLHWNGYGSGEHTASSGLVGSGLGSGFHTYGFLWNSTNYAFNIDGTLTWSTNFAPSQRTEIILLSCEVDSNSFCGIVPPGGYGNFLVSTTTTVVDYVRYYAPTSTVYWTGYSSPDWSDGGNWVSNMVPASASDVVFNYLSTDNFDLALTQDTPVNSLSIEEAGGPINISGTNMLTVGGGGIDMLSAVNNAVIASPLVLGANQTWQVGTGLVLYVTGTVSGSGNLTVSEQGTVALDAVNTCSGLMTVSNGELQVNGSINNSVNVQGGALGGTGIVTGPVQVGGTGTLTGTATFTAPVQINAGGTLSPGAPFGTLTISNTLELQPGSTMSVAVNGSVNTCGQIAGLSAVTYGGMLVINNQAGSLQGGSAFKLFDAGSYNGTFAKIVPQTPGAGLAWDATTLNVDGTLRITATNPPALTTSLAGNQMTLSWPAINTGWILQAQTNWPHNTGLTTNWVTVAGLIDTNAPVFNVDPTLGSVFYRLQAPTFTSTYFAKGDILVLQVGNGSINSSGAPGFLDDYFPAGGALQVQLALPKSGANALIFGGSSYDGALSISADGQYIVIPGYNISTGSYSGTLDSSSTTGSPPVPRAVGFVNAAGAFTLAATTTKFSGSTIRSAIADGAGNIWAGGGSSGINYLGNNASPATIWSSSTSTRNLNIVNGNIYCSETGAGIGVVEFTDAPESAANATLVINTANTGSGPSPKGFVINTNVGIAYIADNRASSSGGGIQRFNWNGSAWVYAYSIPYTLTSSKEVYDVIGDFSGPNPVLYAVTGESTQNNLVKVTDTGASSVFTILETAPSGDAFRGLVFAP
jgi:hypothetical protein